jgi:hypothetical protein
MNDITKFIGGIFIGFSITTHLMIFFVVDPIKKEAIERGFAEMKLKHPTIQNQFLLGRKQNEIRTSNNRTR